MGQLEHVFSPLLSTRQQVRNYESLFANVNGVRLHYLKSGSGKKQLVLIHGFGDDARMWLPLFADFDKDYTIIAPDLRGLGQSSREKTGYEMRLSISKRSNQLTPPITVTLRRQNCRCLYW